MLCIWFLLVYFDFSCIHIFRRQRKLPKHSLGPVKQWSHPLWSKQTWGKALSTQIRKCLQPQMPQPFPLLLLKDQVSMSAYCWNKPGGRSGEMQISCWSLNALLRYPENLKELWIIATKRSTESPEQYLEIKGGISNICVMANRQSYVKKEGRR